jgi:hypothetical protein
MGLAEVLQAQQRFATAQSMEQLSVLFRQESRRLGFDSFIYALRVPTNFSNAQVILLDGYPQGWVKRYFDESYFDSDPVMAWCIKSIVPVLWSDLVLEAGSKEERMMQEAAAFGLRDGVTMPVHSPQGELGILSLSIDAPPELARQTAQAAIPYVQLMANHLHQAVRHINGLMSDEGPNLTVRERECLSWAADGKASTKLRSCWAFPRAQSTFISTTRCANSMWSRASRVSPRLRCTG